MTTCSSAAPLNATCNLHICNTDCWSLTQKTNDLDNMQNTNTNIVFPTPEGVKKEISFSAPQTRKLKINLLQHNSLNLWTVFECLGFWWQFLPRDTTRVTSAWLVEFLLNVSREHSMSTSVLQGNPNETRGKLVVFKTVNIGEEASSSTLFSRELGNFWNDKGDAFLTFLEAYWKPTAFSWHWNDNFFHGKYLLHHDLHDNKKSCFCLQICSDSISISEASLQAFWALPVPKMHFEGVI